MKHLERFKQLILGAVVPVAVLVFWQIAGTRPDMAGIVPTPLAVLQGWKAWVFGASWCAAGPVDRVEPPGLAPV
jgi:ABC-type nitrate/sulfonate/bicarbonate transport system permease component